jgi:hypothetical protein
MNAPITIAEVGGRAVQGMTKPLHWRAGGNKEGRTLIRQDHDWPMSKRFVSVRGLSTGVGGSESAAPWGLRSGMGAVGGSAATRNAMG